MQGQKDQNLVKSIIYGNLIQNSYGLMRSLCSAINSKEHIDKIILFLRNNRNFQKYNKFIYAFRLEQLPNQNQLFITQDQPMPSRFLQGYNDDTGLQGNGQKLLALLQKFNVRNVLVIVALRQKDSLRQLNAEHYVQIIKCAKDLLSSLYDKVILSKNQQPVQEQYAPEKEKIPIQVKQYLIPLEQFKIQQKPQINPNYVGQRHVRRVKQATLQAKKQPQIAYLNSKIKQLASILQEIIQKFTENEDAQVKFSIRYDKNKKVVKVFNLFALLFDLKTKQDLLQNDMSTYLRSITTRNMTPTTIRILNQELMSNRSIKSQNIAKQSKICGILMQFLQVLLKSYSFAKKLAIIQSQIQDNSNIEQEQAEQDPNQLII